MTGNSIQPWELAKRRKYGTRAFELAAAQGWSDSELARRCGLTPSVLHRIRRGKHGCGAHAIQAILAAFPDLTFEELFYLEGDVERPA